MGPVALFLCSDGCRYLTGQTFMVDGGTFLFAYQERLRCPSTTSKRDDHIVVITIDRPEAPQLARPVPLPRSRQGVARLPLRRRRSGWRSSPASTGASWPAPTSRPTSRRSPSSPKEIGKGEVTEIDGCRSDDGTEAVLRNVKIYKPIIAADRRPVRGRRHGDARRRRHPHRHAERAVRGDGAEAGAVRRRRHDRRACRGRCRSRRRWSSC